jgi:hypothetical protein
MGRSKRDTVIRNILANHGRGGLERLIQGLREAESGQSIGDALGVTRERVRQWKGTLGTEVRSYLVADEVLAALSPPPTLPGDERI